MKVKPKISRFLDEEEQALAELVESDLFSPQSARPGSARLLMLKEAAQATINEERVKISLRLPRTDLERLKARALREGMPYQTLINSILHKAASG